MTAQLHIGDALTVLQTLPDASVDLVVTSPPYLALRSYLPADHPAKSFEMGSEPHPAVFIDHLLDITEQLRRVLAPHGSICVELGDTYSGSGGAGGDWSDSPATTKARVKNGSDAGPVIRHLTDAWPAAKSLCMVPEAYRLALAYGANPFNGRTTPRWRIRNVVRHFRPNPPVGALGDKWRPATSDWAVACTGSSRYFDLDAVRGDLARDYTDEKPTKGNRERDRMGRGRHDTERTLAANPAGAPPLDWYQNDDDLTWKDGAGIVLPTHGFPGAHYATFSPKLIARFIQCMTPSRVCQECGKPSERIIESDRTYRRPAKVPKIRNDSRADGGAGPFNHDEIRTTLGWSDCGHNAWRPGVVLDPFAGSGTTLEVATGHGYDAIGIELNPDNLWLIRERVGMFLEVA